jgi:hypothetical protein
MGLSYESFVKDVNKDLVSTSLEDYPRPVYDIELGPDCSPFS